MKLEVNNSYLLKKSHIYIINSIVEGTVYYTAIRLEVNSKTESFTSIGIFNDWVRVYFKPTNSKLVRLLYGS